MRLRSQLGHEYAKAFDAGALEQIKDWAMKAAGGLEDSAAAYDKTNPVLASSLNKDAEVYSTLALSLIAITRSSTVNA